MFSTITTALSTSIPSAMMRLNRMTKFSVSPITEKMTNESSIESGMAMPTSVALRTPRKNSSTAITKMMPEMMLFSRSATSVSTFWASSPVNVTSVPAGKGKSATTWRTRPTVSMMFSPGRFLTLSEITCRFSTPATSS